MDDELLSPDGPEVQASSGRDLYIAGRDLHVDLPSSKAPARTPKVRAPNQLRPDVKFFKNQEAPLSEMTRQTGVGSGKRPFEGLPIVVLTGLGGTGKTALAMHWAQGAVDEFGAGALVAELRGDSREDSAEAEAEAEAEAASVLEDFLRALEVPGAQIPASLDARAARFRQETAGRRILVVLDNVFSEAQLHRLMPGGQGPVVIITSRVWLGDLAARQEAQHIRLDALPRKEAAELLEEVMMAGGRHGEDEEELAELARLCGYYPLALRVAGADAARYPAIALADLVKDLRDGPGPGKGQVMWRVFNLAYQRLGEEEARLFRALALHDGPDIGEKAAAAAAGMQGRPAREALRALTDANLLLPLPSGRYLQFHLVRDYAKDKVRELEEETEGGAGRRDTVVRIVRWYTATALNATRKLFPGRAFDAATTGATAETFPTEDTARRWLDVERPNLRANAQAAQAAGLHRHAWELAMVLSPYHASHFTFDDWSVLSELALAAASEMNDPAAIALALDNRGRFLLRRGSLEEAASAHRQALEIQEQIDDEPGACRSLNALGLVCFEARDLSEAIRYSTEARNRAIRADQPRWYGAASVVLAHAHLEAGQPARTVEILEPLLGFFDVRDDALNRGTAYRLIAEARRGRAEYEEAQDAIDRALRIAVAKKNEVWEADWLVEAARIRLATGAPARALEECERAVRLQQDVGDLGREAAALDCEAEVLENLDRTEEAAEARRHAAELRQN